MRRTALLLVIAVVLLTSPAWAWWDGGHKIVASIAFRSLTRGEQEKIVAILRSHPRFKIDFVDAAPDETKDDADLRHEWYFQQAAVWPDIARNFKGDDLETYHRATWHYINVPHYLTDADRAALGGKLTVNVKLEAPPAPIPEMNIIQTIRSARTVLGDKTAGDRDKAMMIMWLFHDVGDIHQPLHSTALFSPKLFPEGDRGGNSVLTEQRKNLHALWDSFPGGMTELKTARNDALRLMENAELAALGKTSAGQLDEQTWLDESRELALSVVYDSEVLTPLRAFEKQGALKPITLSEEYLRRGGRVCERRVVQAGYRLGVLLKKIAE